MIAEAMKLFAELIRQSEPVPILDKDPKRTVFLVAGAPLEIGHDPAERSHHVACLGDVIALANRFAQEGHKPAVWYLEDDVCLVIDDDGHRNSTVRFNLVGSDVFVLLKRLYVNKPWHDQKQFVRLLRVELAGTLLPGELLDRVRRLRFENGVVTTGHVTRKDESLGREIRSKVDADGEIPEEVTLQVPVYKAIGERERYPLRCAVEVDPAMGKLQILPLPDEIERVQHLAMASLAARLAEGLDEGIPAYYGRPA